MLLLLLFCYYDDIYIDVVVNAKRDFSVPPEEYAVFRRRRRRGDFVRTATAENGETAAFDDENDGRTGKIAATG